MVTTTDKEKDALRYGLAFLEVFRSIRPTMPLQHAITFMLVALDEGLSVQEYSERAGVAQSVMTRHLLDLGEFDRNHQPGLGLLYQKIDLMNRRRHVTFLSPEGRALLHKIVRQIG